MRNVDLLKGVPGLKKATASKLLHRLADNGLVFPDVREHGSTYFQLTDKGREIAESKQLQEETRNSRSGTRLARLPEESEIEFRERQDKLRRRLLGVFQELKDQVRKEVSIFKAGRSESVKDAFETITRNRIIEDIMDKVWSHSEMQGKSRVQYLVWYKTSEMSWEDAEGLFRILNMPPEEWEKRNRKMGAH
jgi:DNA-binding PadR family transcriptional regulator